MRRLIDTLVLVGAINPKDSLHQVAQRHLDSVAQDPETFIPFSSALEFDLVLKGRGYTFTERENALDWLGYSVPPDKITCNSALSLKEAIKFQEKGMGYFDSMIAALAIATHAVVITKDKEISEVVKTDW